MAFKFRLDGVTTKSLRGIKDLKKIKGMNRLVSKPVTRDTAKKIGKTTVNTMLDMVSKGKNPIKKERLRIYSKSYKKQIKSQVGLFAGKAIRPVNLKLSGKFLKKLKFKVKGFARKVSLRIGFFDRRSIKLEKFHRDGTGNARRPIIPVGEEQFKAPINKAAKEIMIKDFLKRFEKILK